MCIQLCIFALALLKHSCVTTTWLSLFDLCRLSRLKVWLNSNDYMVLRTEDGSQVDGAGVPHKGRSQPVGIMIKEAMQTLVVPDLEFIREHMPDIWELILREGKIHIVIGADNHSRQIFDGRVVKSEIGMLKILLPVTDSAQQSCCLAIPVFMHEGELTLLVIAGLLFYSLYVYCC